MLGRGLHGGEPVSWHVEVEARVRSVRIATWDSEMLAIKKKLCCGGHLTYLINAAETRFIES